MSLETLNEHERRIHREQNHASSLQHALDALQAQQQHSLLELQTAQQRLQKAEAEHAQAQGTLALRDREVAQLRGQLQAQESRYKELFDGCLCAPAMERRQQQYLLQSHGLDMETNSIKLRASEANVRALEKILKGKKEVIRKVSSENRKLKESILKLTHEYHQNVVSIKKQDLQTHMRIERVAELSALSKGFFPEETKCISEFHQKIHEIQFAEIRQRQASLEETNRVLSVRAEELERLLRLAKREYGATELDQVYAEGIALREQNRGLRAEIEGYEKVRALGHKMGEYVKRGETLSSLEQRLTETEDALAGSREQVAELGASVARHTSGEYVLQLQSREAGLLLRLESCFLLLGKFNDFHKKVNPHFEVYQYDLLGVDEASRKLLTEVEARQAQTVAQRTAEFQRQERELAERLETCQNHISVLTQENREYRVRCLANEKVLATDLARHGEQRQAKTVEESTAIINRLVEHVQQLKRRELLYETERRVLLNHIELLQVNREYFFVDNGAPSLGLDTIVVPNMVIEQINVDIPQLIRGIEERSAVLQQTVHSLDEERQACLRAVMTINTKIGLLFDQLADVNAKHAQTLRLLEERDSAIDSLQKALEDARGRAVEQQQEHVAPVLLEGHFALPGGSSVSSEFVGELSSVLTHNEQLTARLLEELGAMKHQQARMQEVCRGSAAASEGLVSDNSLLKRKLTEAILELESAISRSRSLGQEVELLRVQKDQLQGELQQRELDSNQYRLNINGELQQLVVSIERNVRTHPVSETETPAAPQSDSSQDNPPSLLQTIAGLKQIISQKNQEIVALENEMIDVRRSQVSAQEGDGDVTPESVSGLLRRAIEVITTLKRS